MTRPIAVPDVEELRAQLLKLSEATRLLRVNLYAFNPEPLIVGAQNELDFAAHHVAGALARLLAAKRAIVATESGASA